MRRLPCLDSTAHLTRHAVAARLVTVSRVFVKEWAGLRTKTEESG